MSEKDIEKIMSGLDDKKTNSYHELEDKLIARKARSSKKDIQKRLNAWKITAIAACLALASLLSLF